jgi:hypothetical protein
VLEIKGIYYIGSVQLLLVTDLSRDVRSRGGRLAVHYIVE